ncbi:MAG: VOC family protein [Acidimicrobiales bacterium]|jgi:catechol 2,3-dioxygenase-like lactoylglutathione lyase family enzyme|nr:VOC family protein [Acidimicrobiales bacterium]
MLKVRGLDHLVLNVSDVERSLAWYLDKLGLEPLRVQEWRRGEVLFPSVRVDDTTILDLLEVERTGANVDHLCLAVEGVDIESLAASGEFDVLAPPTRLWGAQGWATSVYVRDPDGNVVELRVYGEDRETPP